MLELSSTVKIVSLPLKKSDENLNTSSIVSEMFWEGNTKYHEIWDGGPLIGFWRMHRNLLDEEYFSQFPNRKQHIQNRINDGRFISKDEGIRKP